MLFSEIYGAYYEVMADIISLAVDGNLAKEDIYRIAEEKAFSESIVAIPEAICNKNWPLITEDMKTPVKHKPAMPLTELQKRWLKSLLSDPRIKLFGVSTEGFEEVAALYNAEDIVYFDKYSDGDDFEDERYINNFRIILRALKEKRNLNITFKGHTGIRHNWVCIPHSLEYSAKDDKFRLQSFSGKYFQTINLGRIEKVALLDEYGKDDTKLYSAEKRTIVMELSDERNALERAMLQFSHFEKETKRINNELYEIKLDYDKEDETEVLIRILSFGPVIKIISPDGFIKQLKERIIRQKSCGLFKVATFFP